MSRYTLNLPQELKREAEEMASKQGISLNQFIMWSVSEKVSSLRQNLGDPNFPGITYRKGASGWVQPVLRGTGIRVQTIVNALNHLNETIEDICREYELSNKVVEDALGFYAAHKSYVDALIAENELLAKEHDLPKTLS